MSDTKHPAPIILTQPGYARVVRGMVRIDAAFPSSRDGQGPWPITVDGAANVLDHRCPAADANRSCWHRQRAETVVLAWHRLVWADATTDAIAKRYADLAQYEAVCGERIDSEERDAVLYEMQAVGALLAERAKEAA